MWLAILSLLAPITVVGVLTEDGDEVCQKGEKRWVNVVPNIGWTSVHGASAPTGLVGEIAIVTGEVAARPAGVPAQSDLSCPPMQARSDWVRSKSGIRYDRTHKAPRHHLKVDAIRPFDGLTVTFDAAKDTVDVRLRNPLAQPFEDVTIVLHYEGCYGKPNKLETVRTVGRIDPGKAIALQGLPARRLQDFKRGNEHALAHVQVVSKGGGAILDIDVDPGALGANVVCKRRKGRKR